MSEKVPLRGVPSAIPQRFYSLDVFRGLAALSVVFWHWQHFFYDGTNPGNPAPDQFPFRNTFALFYDYGYCAVSLFFSMSGFIFFWLYSDAIMQRRLSWQDFALLRISRLYPLHFLTLIWVACFQWLYQFMTGSFFVYRYNDLYHFGLQVLFASAWGFQSEWEFLHGLSFNGPVWSVSIEVLLYAGFFTFSYLRLGRNPVLSLLMAGVGLVCQMVQPALGFSILSFFLGGIAYQSYCRVFAQGQIARFAKFMPFLLGLIWSGVLAEYSIGWFSGLLAMCSALVPAAGHNWFLTRVVKFLPQLTLIGIVFPVTIFAFSVIETSRGSFLKRIAFLGDWSYSAYLLHFPLQLTVVTIFAGMRFDRAFWSTRVALVLFFAVLLGLCWISFNFIERPAQRMIRRRFLKGRGNVNARV
jgi:peptidoglycan/LPS O-acetylase OafA/YrhL